MLLDQGRQHQVRPFDPRAAPAKASGVGLTFDGIELVAPFEPHAPGLSQQQSVGSLIGTGGQLLAGIAIEVLAQPGLAELIGIGVQAVLRAGVGHPRLGKERAAGGIVFGEGPSPLEGLGLSDEADPSPGFP